MRYFLFTASVFALSCGSAAAQNEAYSWAGPYAGAQIGHDQAEIDRALTLTNTSNKYDAKGFFGGVILGYNHQINRLVIGIEGDVDWSRVSGDDRGAGGLTDKTDFNWAGSLRARLGYTFDRTLVYGTGGFAVAGIGQSNDGGSPNTINKSYNGWTAGIGIEHALTDRITSRVEYRHTDFGTRSFHPAGLNPFSNRISDESIRFGITYRF